MNPPDEAFSFARSIRLKPPACKTGLAAAFVLVVGLLAAPLAAANVLLEEGFDDITTLAGDGWSVQNESDPLGLNDWFQGDSTVFLAQTGAPTSYIAANFENTGDTGTIDNWLISPILDFTIPATLRFWTQASNQASFPDRLEVYASTSGTSTTISDFSTPLLSINPNLDANTYPEVWTEYTAALPTLAGSGRIGFRYFVTDAGVLGTNSNYIGIDTVSVATASDPVSVPEPGTLLLLATGLLGVARALRRRR